MSGFQQSTQDAQLRDEDLNQRGAAVSSSGYAVPRGGYEAPEGATSNLAGKNLQIAREENKIEEILKPGGEDKVHGDPTAKSVLDKEHKLAREQGPGRSDLKATADKAREEMFGNHPEASTNRAR